MSGSRRGVSKASLENATASLLREPGVVRFDMIQELDDPTRFLLVEVYRDEEAPLRHKESAHYAKWRDAVAALMAEPRTSKNIPRCLSGRTALETPSGGA